MIRDVEINPDFNTHKESVMPFITADDVGTYGDDCSGIES
jgi:hypothetical protein